MTATNTRPVTEIINYPLSPCATRGLTSSASAGDRAGQGETGRSPKCLVDDAVSLRQLQQAVELLRRRLGVEVEVKPDGAEADRHLLADAERAAEVEVALGGHGAPADGDSQRRRDRPQRHPGAGRQRLQQHVAGAGGEAV